MSRRARGVSIGINLNPDKICNFDCVYCQVDRTTPGGPRGVDLGVLAEELEAMLDGVLGGALWDHPRFADTPEALRGLHDFAFSGDGEPTTEPRFAECVELVAGLKARRGLDGVRIVLITDSACLHHEAVRRGLALLDANEGVVWAKLDAGTEAFYRAVNRTKVPLRRVLKNLATCAAERPIIVQSLFFRSRGEAPSDAEIDAYGDRLVAVEAAGEIAEVHLYSVARRPAEPWCTALDTDELSAIAERVRRRGVRAPIRVI